MKADLSRRAMLGALTATAAVGALAAPAIPATFPTVDRAAWDRAFKAMLAAKVASDNHDAEAFKPAQKAVQRATAHLAKPSDRCSLDALIAHNREHNRLAELAVPGYDEICGRSDDLCNSYTDLEWEVLLIPAPDGEALLWKLNSLWGDDLQKTDEEYCSSYRLDAVRVVMADATRLLSAGRA